MYLCWWTICPRGYLSFGIYSTMSIQKETKEILAGTSPSIKRCHSVESVRGTGSNRLVSAPRIVLRDIKNMTFIQSSDNRFWYKNANNFIQIKNCQVSLENIYGGFSTNRCTFRILLSIAIYRRNICFNERVIFFTSLHAFLRISIENCLNNVW